MEFYNDTFLDTLYALFVVKSSNLGISIKFLRFLCIYFMIANLANFLIHWKNNSCLFSIRNTMRAEDSHDSKEELT